MTKNIKNNKQKYISPVIETVVIDTDISLHLLSTPPIDPGGGGDPWAMSAPPSPLSPPPPSQAQGTSPFGGEEPIY